MGTLIYLIIAIIYALLRTNYESHGSNRYRNGYGRYGVYGMQDDFSLDYDPLEDVRRSYNERLQVYYKHNAPKTYLINRYCEARLIKENDGKVWFYVKERTEANSKFFGNYFEVKGNNTHASTMWAIIDMEFNSLTRYADIRSLYYKLNQSYETVGGLKYFNQPIIGGLPKPIVNRMAQNEFCRMEVLSDSNGEKYILCSEIWGALQYDKPKKFVIKADKLILYGILSELSDKKNKMLNYLNLLYKYSQKEDCTVREINDNIKPEQNTNSAKKLLEEAEQQEQKPTLHVDLDEKPEEKHE